MLLEYKGTVVVETITQIVIITFTYQASLGVELCQNIPFYISQGRPVEVGKL